MFTPLPQLKTNSLIDRINGLSGGTRFIDPEGGDILATQWHSIHDDLVPLFKVAAREAWAVRGALYGLSGNRDEMERSFHASDKLGFDLFTQLNWLHNRARLGMFSKAQDLYLMHCSPEKGQYTTMAGYGFATGSVHTSVVFAGRAIAMGLIKQEAAHDELQNASELLKSRGISEGEVARHLDIAGNICHKHGYVSNVAMHVTLAGEFFSGVTYALQIPASTSEAFELNMELAEAEESAGIQRHVEYDVVFRVLQ
ncbi:hypothetical protein [Robbsia andropogonis]|uniref:hypothetical protein n=1 Tax=Robbsia andropogonis TaxID=28092 RepID=UPI002A6A9986|nr:hypothetical protein [Robbsia andropogonis]